MPSRYSIRLRVTDEDLAHIDEVREYLERRTETMFGKPTVNNETVVLHLMRFGWNRARTKIRSDAKADQGAPAGDPGADADPGNGGHPGDGGDLGAARRIDEDIGRYRQSLS